MNRIHLLAFIGFIFLTGSCGSDTNKDNGKAAGTPIAATVTGEAIYKKNCVTCHQANGEGLPNTFPPLAKSDYLANREKAIRQVINGGSGDIVVNGKTYNSTMTQLPLSDDEIASVLTYVYSNFGNGGSAVSADEVKTIRAKM
jgi:nitrite reductase (NO-forming)